MLFQALCAWLLSCCPSGTKPSEPDKDKRDGHNGF
jgi:hypothetical protein